MSDQNLLVATDLLYTQHDFIHGQPAEMRQASQRPKILVVGLHGTESLAARLAYHIATAQPELAEHVDYVCGNPRAAAETRRYIDTDLNRSFKPTGQPTTYEERRAQAILQTIADGGYDYVLDVHTSTTDVGAFFLVPERSRAIDAVIAASPITRVVVMPPAITAPSLIGNATHAISIEYSNKLAQAQGVQDLIKTIEGLMSGPAATKPQPREFFYVTRPIPKAEDPGIATKNFELCASGYYPVLLGNNSYRKDPTKPYVGFAATRKETVTL